MKPSSTAQGTPPQLDQRAPLALHPTPDKAAILAALAAMFDPDDVIELRVLHKGKTRPAAGYFDGAHRADLADAAVRLNRRGAATYVTSNRIDPQLLGRYCNRIEESANSTTADQNVIRRRWLLLDFDPVRPKDTSATDEQLRAAHAKAQDCYEFLRDLRWPEPLRAGSGNGYHLLYPLDLPNDEPTRDLVKDVLAALAARFDDAAVTVDRSVFNAARIVKLYGSVANKGDHAPHTPWRLSSLESTPPRDTVVTEAQLRALCQTPDNGIRSGRGNGAAPPVPRDRDPFDLDAFLARLGIDYQQDSHDGRERYKLATCPFNPDHVHGEAAIFRSPDGTLGFKCMHSSCVDKRWSDVRALVDGPRPVRTNGANGMNGAAHDVVTGHDSEDGAMAEPPPLSAYADEARNAPGVQDRTERSWPTPAPIEGELPPAPCFDADVLLPDVLRDFVLDEASRMVCAPDFVAAALIVTLGTLVGACCAVKPKRLDDWIVTPNLWGGVVGEPGSLKTPAIAVATRNLERLEAREAEKLKDAKLDYAAEMAAHRAREATIQASMKTAAGGPKTGAKTAADGNEQGAKPGDNMAAAIRELRELRAPDEPHQRRYKTNDATVEKIGDLLVTNPAGLLVLRDELTGLLASWERDGHEGDRAFYLEAWNGTAGINIDRIGRGSLFVPNLCLGVFGGIQPDLMQRYLTDIASSLDNDGRIQRFQVLVYPDPTPWQWRDRAPKQAARANLRAVFDRLADFDPVAVGATPANEFVKLPYFSFDGDAREIFIEWSCDLHNQRIAREDDPLLRQHLVKYPKLFCALALVLHLAEDRQGDIRGDTAIRAAAWCQYLEGHARRVYGLITTAPVTAAQTLARKISEGKLKDGFTARDVRRKGWSGLSNAQQVEAALELLSDASWILGIKKAGEDGRPTTTYTINPRALKGDN
ncbi:YfjI family protein [Burkholderia pseudomallei]|uniref:YfjI family protein n=1 Tax=Burkholderia pseudomallei TaxID=28450 RepID=UPI0005104A39|nr:YfjI family protein [Burkholderia pseudomallei]KGC58572.1 hypothetical protein DP56_1338 [Burkholderia pseudomallei]